MKRLFVVLCCALPALAQGPIMLPPQAFPTALKQFLGLSDAQADAISRMNSGYLNYVREKQARMTQVQRELVVHTAASPIEPMELGLRYAELETIRREIQERLAKTRQEALATFNDAQKLKLKALSDAMALQPLITQAQCENLLIATGQLLPAPRIDFNYIGRQPDIAGFLLGLPTTGCGPVFTGDMTPTPTAP